MRGLLRGGGTGEGEDGVSILSQELSSDIIHVGRNPPKGYHEVGKAIHLGRGIWALRCRKTIPGSREALRAEALKQARRARAK